MVVRKLPMISVLVYMFLFMAFCDLVVGVRFSVVWCRDRGVVRAVLIGVASTQQH